MKAKTKISLLIYFSILLSLIIFFSSCKASKPISEFKEEIKKDSISEKIETNKITEVSKAIVDCTKTNVPVIKTNISKDCDSVCNARVDEILRNFNSYKKSGANKYRLLYNENKRQLLSIAEMEEIINQQGDSIYSLQNKKVEIKTVKEVVEKKVYPKWLVYLSILGVLFIVFLLYRFSRIFM